MQRRSYLKSIAALSVSSSAIAASPVGAVDSEDPVTTEQLGLESEIQELLEDGDVEEAKSILKKENIDHSFSRTTENRQEITDEDLNIKDTSGGVGTNDYQQDEMIANCGLIRKSGDIYTIWGDVSAPEDAIGFNRFRQDWVKDVVGFSANSSVWSPNDSTRSNLKINVTGGNHDVTMHKYHEEDGVACKIDLDSRARNCTLTCDYVLKPITVSLVTTIEHIGDSETQPVSIVYRHTGSPSPWGRVESIDIGGVLALSLDLNAREVWDYPLKAQTDLS